MSKISTEIVLVTNSKYIEICNLFKRLINKNWYKCPYKLTLSYCGMRIDSSEFHNTLYNGQNASLPSCIYNVMKSSKSDFYMCFLGDAFIYRKINEDDIKKIIKRIECERIDYLRIFPTIYNENKLNGDEEGLRMLSYKDRGISFVAFVASRRFIENEFANNITDYEFEMKFLRMTYYKDTPKLWSQYKIYIVDDNVFKIVPGIEKGRWNRDSYKLIKKFNKEIELPKLKKIPMYIHMIRKLMYWILRRVSTKYVRYIKMCISKLHIYKFASKE